MSLRLAALKALIAFEQLYATGWTDYPSSRLWDHRDAATAAMAKLETALGIAPLYPEHDDDLTPIGLLETLAESLARDKGTKALAEIIQSALVDHKRWVLTTQMTAAE